MKLLSYYHCFSVLRVLIESYPDFLTADDIGTRVIVKKDTLFKDTFSSRGISKILSTLEGLDLLVKVKYGNNPIYMFRLNLKEGR